MSGSLEGLKVLDLSRFIAGPMCAMQLSEMFSTEVRYTGVSVGSQLAGVFGGFTPMVATALVAWAGGGFWPIAWMIIVSGAITGFCALGTGETMHRDLHNDRHFEDRDRSRADGALAKTR